MVKEFPYDKEVEIISKHRHEYEMLDAKRSWDDTMAVLRNREMPIDAVRYLRCNLQIISARERNKHLSDDEIEQKVIRLYKRGMGVRDIQFEVGLNHGTIKNIIND